MAAAAAPVIGEGKSSNDAHSDDGKDENGLDAQDHQFLDALGLKPIEHQPIEDTGYKYYWDDDDEGDEGEEEEEDVGVGRIAYDNARWAGIKVVQGLELIGNVTANILGLDQSQYQYYIDAARRERVSYH